MIIREQRIRVANNRLTLTGFGDPHIDSELFDKARFDTEIARQVADKNAYCIFVGDVTEDDRPSTRQRRKDMHSDRDEALSLDDKKHMLWMDQKIIPIFQKIAPRCLGILDGDHYRRYGSGITSTQYMCMRTGIPYLGERMAALRLLLTPDYKGVGQGVVRRYDILVTHGAGSAATPGGDLNNLLKKLVGFADYDLVMSGHTHKSLSFQQPIQGIAGNGELRERMFTVMRCGTFLKSYKANKKGYAEYSEYTPLKTGCARLHLHFAKLGKSCSWRISDIKCEI